MQLRRKRYTITVIDPLIYTGILPLKHGFVLLDPDLLTNTNPLHTRVRTLIWASSKHLVSFRLASSLSTDPCRLTCLDRIVDMGR